MIHFGGIENQDFQHREQNQTDASWNSETGFIQRQGSNISLFPVGEISPELKETFLIKEFRSEILDAIQQKNWKALHWLKQHGVAISRSTVINLGSARPELAFLPAIPFEQLGLDTVYAPV